MGQRARFGFGELDDLAEIEGALTRIGAWTRNGDIQANRLAAIETALDTITTISERSGASMIGAGELGSDAQVTVVATERAAAAKSEATAARSRRRRPRGSRRAPHRADACPQSVAP